VCNPLLSVLERAFEVREYGKHPSDDGSRLGSHEGLVVVPSIETRNCFVPQWNA
jgi:hypothetical protein